MALPVGGAWGESASLTDIEDEVMCPICGTLLEESQSPQADRERELIRNLIAEGRSKEQIKDDLVAEYGPNVLATPSGDGFDLAAWLVPGLGIGIAAAGLAVAAARLSRRRRAGVDQRAEIEAPDRARLERDMSYYDL
jgi:cytochrome c-type biogenesis protein CcmH